MRYEHYDTDPERSHRRRNTVFEIVVGYALFGVLCVLFSDELLAMLASGVTTMTRIGIVKGWIFIALTSFLLYLLIKRRLGEIEESEKQLRQSRERWRSLFQLAPNVIIYLSPDYRILEFNAEAERLYGRNREEVLGRNYIEFFLPPDAREAVEADAMKALAGKPTRNFESAVFAQDGIKRVLNWNVNPVTDNEGKTIGLIAIGRDVTEELLAQETLLRAREEWENIFESISASVLILSQDHRILDANLAAVNAIKEPKERLIGRFCYELFHCKDRPPAGCPHEKLLRTQHPETVEMEMEAFGGIFLVSVSPVFDKTGKIVKTIHFAKDITQRKRTEEALRESEQRYRALFDNNPIQTVVVDRDGRVTDFNMAKRAAGSREPKLGDRMYVDYAGKHQRDMRTELMNCITSEKPKDFPEQAYGDKTLSIKMAPFPGGAVIISEDITERKQAEEALRMSEEHFRRLIENASEAIGIISAEGTILYESPSAERVIGYFPEDVLGMCVFEFVHADDKRILKNVISKLNQNPDSVVSEQLRFRHKDGSWRILESSAKMLPGEDSLVVNYRDITTRKQAENALRESEERYRMLVDNSLTGIHIHQDGKFKFVNRRFCEISGYSEEELFDKPIADLIHPDDSAAVAERIADRLARKEISTDICFRAITKKGEVIWVESLGEAIQYHGKPAILANLIDITERKIAEEAIKESEERYRLHFENVSDVIYTTNHELCITGVSPSVERLLGYKPEEILGKKIADLNILAPESFEKAIANTMRVLGGERSGPTEYEFITKNGTKRRGEVISAPLLKDGKVLAITSVARDVTEQRLLEDQLSQAQKLEAVGQLAGGVAHDFNNLLTVILGRAQLSLIKIHPDDPMRENLREIQQAGERAAELTQQLLVFSRKQIVQLKPLNLNETISGMENMLKRLIRENIRVHTHEFPCLWGILADKGQLQQVIVNLAVNARDAMPDGGELHIETANIELDEDYAKTHTGVRPGRYVLLAVSDTGHGMSQEVQKHAFEPFFTTKATGKGTGLGLAIVYGIVKKHDGEISVYSDEGKGTTFKIYLPAAAIGGEPAESFESAQTMPGGTETILVVEDEQPVRRMAVKILSELGYTVWDAPDASAALEALEKSRTAPDILLTDLIMPGMNGKELADKCRQRFSKMPIVLMSGYTSGILKYKDMLKSDMHVLMKPFAPMDLALKVRKALDERPGK